MRLSVLALLAIVAIPRGSSAEEKTFDDFHKMLAQRAAEAAEAYNSSPFSALTKDYFSRFSRNPDASPKENEVLIDDTWRVILPKEAAPLAKLMSGHFLEFMEKRMGVALEQTELPDSDTGGTLDKAIVFLESGGGSADVPESFTISVTENEIRVLGKDPAGLRDGIVKLVDEIGFRHAPILKIWEQVYKPRIAIRHGAHGSYRDTVFMGYNAVTVGGGSLHAMSTSDAIPELSVRRVPGAQATSIENGKKARKYGLKTYYHMSTREKFPKDDPVFQAHPEIRGALTWKEDGEHALCTEHPLVRQYLMESVEGVFRADPELDGMIVIIGGEGFYHCFMRPYGVEKGHTNCERCDALGAETVVSNLCNYMAEAARKVNPNATIYAWPYSAAHVWSEDIAQTGFIERLKPGTGIFTEIVKDEIVEKPEGVKKALWDYSIDLIGPGERAKQQILASREAGIPIRVMSQAEETFEASLLPNIPCMNRWLDRAEALATCGANGAYVWQMGPYQGTSTPEINRFVLWDPKPEKEEILTRFATRLVGEKAAPHLRKAWKYVSDAIDFSPQIGSYYKGVHYLGPAHPMCVDLKAELPEVFYGYYLFYAEITADEAFKGRPTFDTSPPGDPPVFEKYHRNMKELLERAVEEMDAAEPLVPEYCSLMFEAEQSPIRWFYHTARTQVNFHESCRLRDQLHQLAEKETKSPEDVARAEKAFKRWHAVLWDEKQNTLEALPVMEADARLDCYHRGDHSLSHLADMMRKKLEILDREIEDYLPDLAKRCGL